MATHRASSLLAILPIALETGYSKVGSDLEPLKVSVKLEEGNVRLMTLGFRHGPPDQSKRHRSPIPAHRANYRSRASSGDSA